MHPVPFRDAACVALSIHRLIRFSSTEVISHISHVFGFTVSGRFSYKRSAFNPAFNPGGGDHDHVQSIVSSRWSVCSCPCLEAWWIDADSRKSAFCMRWTIRD